MPACRQCVYFDPGGPTPTGPDLPARCTVNADSRRPEGRRVLTRNCLWAICKKHLETMDGMVLEIGPGATRTPRRMLERRRRRARATWHGVDPMFRTQERFRCYKGTVAELPFPAAHFDHVLAFETMEHWEEYGEHPRKGIEEIARVLKPGGTFLATAPIHFHGGGTFVKGDLSQIVSWFDPRLWESVQTEPWRKEFEPLDPALHWLDQPRLVQELVVLNSDQRKPSSWTLEILARRK